VETLGDIENGVDRVARIISDLRGFSRTTHQVAGNFNLSQAVETTLRFFSHAIKDGVEVKLDLPQYVEAVGDQNQFIQVLINLIQNSMDAMSEKTYPEGQERCLSIWATQNGTMAALHIRDNGPGIPVENRNNVFDPFFTTKDVGAGMGLGLSICHQIMAEHGGRILLESTPGEFCEFVLEFPVTAPILEA
jgi:two-component system sensor histidine kinase PhcS